MRHVDRAHGIAVGTIFGGVLAHNGPAWVLGGCVAFVLLSFFFEWAYKTGRAQ